jgi:hypothetical protein
MPNLPTTPEEFRSLLSIPAARQAAGFDDSVADNAQGAGNNAPQSNAAPQWASPDADQPADPDQQRLQWRTEAVDANAYIHARLIGIRPRYLTDPECATLAKRWQDESNRIVNNGLSLVSDDGARDFVNNQAAATLADEGAVIRNQAFHGAAAAHAASRDDCLQCLVQNLTPDPNDKLIGSGIRAYHMMIDNAVDRGFLTADDALAEKRRAALALCAGQYSVLARQDPAQAIQELEDGPAIHPLAQHLPTDVTQGLIAQAKDIQRAQEIDAERTPQLNAEQVQRASDAAEGKYITDLLSDSPTVTAADVNGDNTLTIDAKRRLLIAAKNALDPDPPADVSNATAVDLLNRTRLPVGDPNKLTSLAPVIDAYGEGKLSKADFMLVQKQLADLQSPDGEMLEKDRQDYLHHAAPLVATDTGAASLASIGTGAAADPAQATSDPAAITRRYYLERRIDQKIDRSRKVGEDPFDLFDPTKPNYLDKADAISNTNTRLAQAVPPLIFFARPPVLVPRQLTPLDKLPPGSAGGSGAGKDFPRSLRPDNVPCIYCRQPTTKQPGPDFIAIISSPGAKAGTMVPKTLVRPVVPATYKSGTGPHSSGMTI